MKKNNTTNHKSNIEIIDLEHNETPVLDTDLSEETISTKSKNRIFSFLNIHVLLVVVFLLLVGLLSYKLLNWGEQIDISQIVSDNDGKYHDVLDQFLPLMDASGNVVPSGEVDTIVCFGNAPFADNRGSEDNLANMIAKETGTTVYNCSISGSYLAAQWGSFDASISPMDAYCFYWLITNVVSDGLTDFYYTDAAAALGDKNPPEAEEVVELLGTIDFNEVDVITIMYDASDYLMGHGMYDDINPTSTQHFTGNLEAGIELIQNYFPHIRIIVMSPTYAYALDEEGNYVSSDMYRYNGMDVLSTYVIMEFASCSARNVSFVDHLYGTITEANADQYLIDHLHLNQDGRELVLQRFMDALNRNISK